MGGVGASRAVIVFETLQEMTIMDATGMTNRFSIFMVLHSLCFWSEGSNQIAGPNTRKHAPMGIDLHASDRIPAPDGRRPKQCQH
jgi:hypothetical protein